MKVSNPISSITQIVTRDHDLLDGLLDDDHTMYLKEKASGGLAVEVAEHDHSAAAEAGDLTAIIAGYVLTTQGDVLFEGAAGLERLAVGTAGYFLQSQGAAANPIWAAAAIQVARGQFTRSGTGNEVVAVGFTPNLLVIEFHSGTGSGSGGEGSGQGTATSATAEGCAWSLQQPDGTPSSGISATQILYLVGGNLNSIGTVTVWGANVTINFSACAYATHVSWFAIG